MGQQQLLLLVGGVVIVGMAIVIGISAYSENSAKTNFDALAQDAMRIATDGLVWKTRGEKMGGSPDSLKHVPSDYSDLNFYQLGYTPSALVAEDCYENGNGQFALFPENTYLGILAVNVPRQNMIGVVVNGASEADIHLFGEDWNPVIGGAGADGTTVTVRSHKRCTGPGNTPMHAGVK